MPLALAQPAQGFEVGRGPAALGIKNVTLGSGGREGFGPSYGGSASGGVGMQDVSGGGPSGETSFSSLAIALADDRTAVDASGNVVMLQQGEEYPSAFKWPPPSSDRPKVKIHDVGASQDGESDDVDAKVAAIVARGGKRGDGIFSEHQDYGREISGSVPPKSLAARNRAEREQLAGGRRNNPITR